MLRANYPPPVGGVKLRADQAARWRDRQCALSGQCGAWLSQALSTMRRHCGLRLVG